MIRDIVEANEQTSCNDREMKVLKEHFPECFTSDGDFDIALFEKRIAKNVRLTREGYDPSSGGSTHNCWEP